MPALEKLLPLLALLPHAAATSMKIDYLRLANVRTDPITHPDGPSPHVHSFYGASEAAPSTTYETLRTAAGNTGNVEENKSLYWHPTIYRYVDGQYEIQDTSYFSTYYIWPTGATTAFPDGLKMIGGGAGYEAARQEADCSNPGPCPDGVCDRWNDFFPATSCDELELSMLMPSCWDGVNLDSADHRSHMAYTKNGEADGECPGTHPVRLPQIAVFTRVAPYAGGIHLFSDGTGYFHADYFSGWEAAQLQKVLDECENDSMQSAPDAWCEDHVTFRDAPKAEDVEDDELRAKLEPFQPAPFDATRILSEAVDGVTDLPGGLEPVIDPAASTATNVEEHCFADATNTFHVWIDPYASELGSWKFLECGDTPMPVLAVEKGVTYTFEQFDASNWYHPLAFGTEPDDDEDDLATYYLNGAQIGEDAYEDAFVVAREAWLDASGQSQDEDEGEDEAEDEEEADEEEGDEEEDAGEGGDEEEDAGEGGDADEDRRKLQAAAGYSVTLTVTDEVGDEGEDADEDRRLQASGDLFFMCNVHNYMAGRIKVYENGAPLNPEDTPALLKEPDVVSEYDQSCGTVGVGDYTRASGKCPYDSFICTEGDETPEQLLFGECMYALDCHMNYNMKSILANSDPIVTFIHQMIPHHQNAVNMAKALLKTNTLDASDEDDREMENMMWAIINGQNFQIHQMQDYLAEKSYAESDLCQSSPSMAPVFAPTPRPTPSPTATPGNPTSAPAPAPTPAPVVATAPPVALAAAEIMPAASSSSSGSSDTITTTASGNIIATICVVAAVLIVGAFVAGRRSAQAAVKGPPPARDAVETDKV